MNSSDRHGKNTHAYRVKTPTHQSLSTKIIHVRLQTQASLLISIGGSLRIPVTTVVLYSSVFRPSSLAKNIRSTLWQNVTRFWCRWTSSLKLPSGKCEVNRADKCPNASASNSLRFLDREDDYFRTNSPATDFRQKYSKDLGAVKIMFKFWLIPQQKRETAERSSQIVIHIFLAEKS